MLFFWTNNADDSLFFKINVQISPVCTMVSTGRYSFDILILNVDNMMMIIMLMTMLVMMIDYNDEEGMMIMPTCKVHHDGDGHDNYGDDDDDDIMKMRKE